MQKTLFLLSAFIVLAGCVQCTGDLARVSESIQTCIPRKKAPHFFGTAVKDEKFVQISSEDFAGKYLVLLFYPFDFTYVCPTELIAFSEEISKFKALNTEIIGVSADSHFTHLAWLKTDRENGGIKGLQFPLLADFSKTIASSYGVLVTDPTDELFGAPLRGLFIIDPNGMIRSVQVNDAPVGRSVSEVLRLIEAFQYTDKHGEVCPANWKPGSATIKPDQDLKLEYFQGTYKKEV